jgi:CubicO group peptidase (beta-lactamase class C family)
MRLIDQGRCDLDATIRTYLPDLELMIQTLLPG